MDHVQPQLPNDVIKTYYYLTKPGIIFGNIITMGGGFALASKGHFDGWLFLATLIGLGAVIGSAGVFNNYMDRKIDVKMARTRQRALVQGLISGKNALIFASALGTAGLTILGLFTNLLTMGVALFGFAVYLGLYGFLKTRSVHGTLVGSIAGAVPPVVGYCAVSGRLDLAALILFAIVVLWQMPHFFSIAMYRLADYTAASIPVLPVVKGMQVAKVQKVFYIIAFTGVTFSLFFLGYAGYTYLAIAAVLGLSWLSLSLAGFWTQNETNWARNMFRFSLLVIMGLFGAISLETIYTV